jgi:hypothetical protein
MIRSRWISEQLTRDGCGELAVRACLSGPTLVSFSFFEINVPELSASR